MRLAPYVPDILSAKAKLFLEDYREVASRWRPPDAAGELLGVVTAPQLTAREGLLLSEWMFLRDPWLMDRFSAPEDQSIMDDSGPPEDLRLAAFRVPDPWECVLGYRDLLEQLAALAARLRGGTTILSGLEWPLRPRPVEQEITAATLPMWTYDVATDFAALTTDPTTLLCDLRVVEAAASAVQTDWGAAAKNPDEKASHAASAREPRSPVMQRILAEAKGRGGHSTPNEMISWWRGQPDCHQHTEPSAAAIGKMLARYLRA
jgi:hypothetical protein